jgi:hypothetical protein
MDVRPIDHRMPPAPATPLAGRHGMLLLAGRPVNRDAYRRASIDRGARSATAPASSCPSRWPTWSRTELVPLAWLSRALRGSGGEEHAAAEQVEAGAPVRLPLRELEPGDPALGLAVAPRRRERRPDGGPVYIGAAAMLPPMLIFLCSTASSSAVSPSARWRAEARIVRSSPGAGLPEAGEARFRAERLSP